jgi:hypothetical protein
MRISTNRFIVFMIIGLFIFTAGCGCGDDDDDSGDDDASDDDTLDDDTADDDVDDDADDSAGDDTADDDTAGDDTVADDTTDDDTSTDDTTDDDAEDVFYSETFESYTPPFLTGDWETDIVGGTVSIVSLKAASGQVLQIIDADGSGDYAYALMEFEDASELNGDPYRFRFDYRASEGLLALELLQYFGTPEIVVKLPVNGTAVSAETPSKAPLDCGYTMDDDTWYKIELLIDPDTREFSLAINDTVTSCSGIGFLQTYVDDTTEFMFIGFSTAGVGGEGQIDNITLYRPVE